MKNSKMKHLDSASSRSGTRRIGIRNRLKIIVTSALLLAATSAVAGIIFVPVGNRYTNPEIALVDIQNGGDGTVRILTTGLTGEMSLDGSDVPPEFEAPVPGCARFPFEQRLELVINPSLGVVEGSTRGRISTQDGTLEYRGEVRGNATCVPSGGRGCGQLIVDLEMRGTLSDPYNPASVGQIRVGMLGSLIWGETDLAHWAAMSTNATLGGNELLFNSWMEYAALEHASCRGAL